MIPTIRRPWNAPKPDETFRSAMPPGWNYEQAEIDTGPAEGGNARMIERGYIVTDAAGDVVCYAMNEPSSEQMREFIERSFA